MLRIKMKEKEEKVVRKVNMDKGRPCTSLWTSEQIKKTVRSNPLV